MNGFPLLSLTVFLPLVALPFLAASARARDGMAKWIALVTASLTLICSALAVWFGRGAGFHFLEESAWLSSIGAHYRLGLDALSLPLFFLTALLTLVAVFASWREERQPAGFFALLLILECGLLGVFSALDLILFFVFWESVLIPLYLLIAIWGGERRRYAALKTFIFTASGSALALIGFLFLRWQAGPQAFDMTAGATRALPLALQIPAFLLIAVGMAVKVPVFPLHTWLPDAHVEAPTAVSVMLAGVLLKMGTYGLLRMAFTGLPAAFRYFQPAIIVLAVLNVLYGSLAAYAQKDLKRMVAYASIGSMGLVLLGASSGNGLATGAALMHNFNHGLYSALLFLSVGMIYERYHTRMRDELGGIAASRPLLGGLFVLAALFALGMPASAVFVSESGVIIGTLGAHPAAAAAAAAGLLITAAYLLRASRRAVFGGASEAVAAAGDVPEPRWHERAASYPLVFLLFLLGIAPGLAAVILSPATASLLSALLDKAAGQ